VNGGGAAVANVRTPRQMKTAEHSIVAELRPCGNDGTAPMMCPRRYNRVEACNRTGKAATRLNTVVTSLQEGRRWSSELPGPPPADWCQKIRPCGYSRPGDHSLLLLRLPWLWWGGW
jgi:hypothetical protein